MWQGVLADGMMGKRSMIKLEVNTMALVKFVGWGLLLWLAYQIRDVLLLLFIAYIVMSAVSPAVARVERWGIPRWLGILSVFLLVGTVLVMFVTLSFAPLIEQTQNLARLFPDFFQRSLDRIQLSGWVGAADVRNLVQGILQSFSTQLSLAPINLLRLGVGVFGGFLDFIMVLVFAFYLSIEREKVHHLFAQLIPGDDKKRWSRMILRVENKLGAWMRGEFVLMLVVGTMSYLGLILIGVPYAFPLAVIAGFLEIVPIVGPIISAFPAMLVALAFSPIQAVSVMFLFVLVQQLENNLIVPRVMKQAVGLDPLAVILALMVGGRLAGPMGALLSVPALAVIMIIHSEGLLDGE